MNKNARSLAVLTLLFFMWGFITCLNDILIPYLKEVFQLSTFQSTLVQTAFFLAYFFGSLGYFISSMIWGDPINKIGYKKAIIAGLIVSAAGCLMFVPASYAKVYALFLGALFLLGLGLTILQIACNPIVTLLGKPETASGRLNLTQAFNSFGTTIAPALGGYLIFEFFAENGTLEADNVRVPYMILSGLFLVVVGIIAISKIPSFSNDEDDLKKGNPFEVLKFGQLKWGIPAIFCYVGGEVAIGSLLITYMGQADVLGLDHLEASKYLSFYWGGAMIGRFMGAVNISEKSKGEKALYSLLLMAASVALIIYLSGLQISEMWPYFIFLGVNFVLFMVIGKNARLMLSVFAIVNIAFLATAIFKVPGMMVWPILSIGLFNSIMWSNIFSMAIKDLNTYTSQGSSLLVMAILGGAIVPALQGLLADYISLEYSFILPVLCFLYLFYYGARYNKIKTEAVESK